MRAFVTGLDGFVGQWLARELLGAGVEVTGGSRAPDPSFTILTKDEAAAFPWSTFELSDEASLVRALKTAKADSIFHLAAQAFVGESLHAPLATFETNVLGTARLLEAARIAAPDATLVHVGSADAYGHVDPSELPIRETVPLRPANPYAASKAAAEMIVLQQARAGVVRAIATRSFNHTGPGQRPDFAVPSFAIQIADIARQGSRAALHVGNLDARRDFTDVRDVVRAYRLLVERGTVGTAYNICSGTSVSMRSIVDDLMRLASVDAPVEIDPARVRPSDAGVVVGDNSLLRKDTGWSPNVAWRQTLRDVYDWFARA